MNRYWDFSILTTAWVVATGGEFGRIFIFCGGDDGGGGGGATRGFLGGVFELSFLVGAR